MELQDNEGRTVVDERDHPIGCEETQVKSRCSRLVLFLTPHRRKCPDEAEGGKSSASPAGVVSDWAEESTMHGIKFIFAKDVWIFRRLFWIAVVGCFIYVLVWLTSKQFARYNSHKTVTKTLTNFEGRQPFPAVTLCNYNMIRNSSVTDPKERELLKLMFMPSLANRTVVEDLGNGFLNTATLGKYLRNGAFSREETFRYCAWNEEEIPCNAAMTSVLTQHGYCYTFNAWNRSDTEYVTIVPGSENGLVLTMITRQDDYFVGDSAAAGFKVLVHDPSELPDMKYAKSVEPGHIHFLAVTRQQNVYLPPPVMAFGDRPCVDTDREDVMRMLQFHDMYSVSACLSECKARFVQQMCGCIPASSPGQGIPECGALLYVDCAQHAYRDISGRFDICNCPLPCKTTFYKVSTSAAFYPNDNALDILKYNDSSIEYLRKNLVQLRVFYESPAVLRNEQVLEFTREDLYASFGGYIGLAIGASAVTIIELMEMLLISVFHCIVGNVTNRKLPVRV